MTNLTLFAVQCVIQGQVDFIWGQGRAVLDSCTIRSVSKGTTAYITADGNSDPNFQKGGILIKNATISLQAGVQHYLGRTWGTNAHVAFANTTLPAGIAAPGWLVMGNHTTATQVGEFNTSGPGANQTGRVSWAYKYASVPTTEVWLNASGSTSWLSSPRY